MKQHLLFRGRDLVVYAFLFLAAAVVATGIFAPSCALSPQQAERLERVAVPLAKIGLAYAVSHGHLEPGDSVAIVDGLAVVVSEKSGQAKIYELAQLGLERAVAKGDLKEGDRVLIESVSEALLIPGEAEATSGKSPVGEILPPAGG